MTTKHSVVLPNGYTATRSSKTKVYSHVTIVGPQPKCDRIKNAEARIKRINEDMAFKFQVLTYVQNGGELAFNPSGNQFANTWAATGLKIGGSWVDRNYGLTFYGTNKDMTEAEARAFILEGSILSLENTKKELAHAEATLAEIEAEPEFINNEWFVAGWSSRYDLARKVAGTDWGNREVRIVETKVAA